MLEHGHANSVEADKQNNSVFHPPVYIHPSATVEDCVIGPHTAIGANCKIQSCIIRDSIVDDSTDLSNLILEHSLIGRNSHLHQQAGILNIGDHTELSL
jgi:glucose-1-phosphate thymidylyltransferase